VTQDAASEEDMSYRITYIGDGVASNKLGAFQNGTTANTDDETLARELAGRPDQWRVTDKDGTLVGGPPKAEPAATPFEAPKDQWDRRGKKSKADHAEVSASSES
jgi:hypothetical protein